MNLNFTTYTMSKSRLWRRLVAVCMLTAGIFTQSSAQTTLINPTGDGGFETGTTLTANGWTAVANTAASSANWAIATANLTQGSYTFAKTGSNAAFVSNSSTANTWTYGTAGPASTVHIYRDITFPAGQTNINLSFRWNANGESTNDILYVYLAPTTRTPLVNLPVGSNSTATGWTGTGTITLLGSYNLATAGAGSVANISIPASVAGNGTAASTMRLVFTWKNDASGGGEPPAALDDISLTSICPNAITGVTLNSVGSTTANISWTALTGATGYVVRYKKLTEPATVATWTTPTATATPSIVLSGLSSSTGYEYQIAAVGTGCGTFTSSAQLTTACSGPTVTTTSATRCGQGIVTLSATPSAGASTLWYASAIGGNSIFSGNSFVTPNLTTTTTYYASARTIASIVTPVTVGTGTTPSANYDGVYYHQSGGKKTQYLFLASELTAAGVAAGNINSASFNVTTAGTSYADFNLSMGSTTATVMTTTLQGGLQPVYNAASVTPVVGANAYTFSAPFFWDGTSNVILEVCWSNNNTGGVSAVNTMNNPGFVCTSYFSANSQQAAVLCGTTAGATTTSLRPNVIFGNFVACEGPRVAATATITAAPTLTLSSPQSGGVCSGTVVTITATSANTGYKYMWSPLDSGRVINRTPTATTTFVVTATDTTTGTNAGCVYKDSIRINVNAKPPTPVISPNPTTICQGSSVSYAAASVVTGVGQLPITWINVTGLYKNSALTQAVLATDTISASIFAAPTTNQTYRAIATIQGCRSDTSLPGVVNVVAKFATTITVTSPSATTCAPGTVNLSAPSGSYTYQWKLGGTNISGATSRTYAAPVSGSYTVTMTSTASSACVYTSDTAVTVTINPQPSTTITASGSLLFCTGGSVVLTAPTGTNFGYVWNKDGTPQTTDTLRNYTATTPGNYTVTVTNRTTGCSATTTTPVTVTFGSPAAPIAAAAATNTICDRDTIRLRTNNAPGLTYQWYLGGTATSNAIAGATDSVYKAFAAGTYYVVVSVTGQPGCSGTSTGLTVTVNPIPVAAITAGTGATTFCQGDSVVLTATPAGLNYQWRLGTAPATTPNNNQTYAAKVAGSYTAIVTNPATGCFATSNAIAVTVNALPSATITTATTTTLCAGNSVVLNANTGTGLVYQWFLGTTAITGATSASYTTNAAGAYRVRVRNANGCEALSAATTVTVVALPAVGVTPTGPVNLCTGDTLTLTGPTGTSYTYQWKNGATNALGASTTKDYKTTIGGVYTVIVTANGCSATSAATTVTLLPAPTALISPNTATTACDSVVLTSGSTNVTYQWRLNGNNIIGATTNAYTANTSGNYSLRVTGTNGCSSNTAATAVTVNPSPYGNITYNTPLVFCQGGAVVLNTIPGTTFSYEWRRDTVAITGANTGNYIANQSGNYSVKVVNTATGCSRVSSPITVRVNPLPTPTIQYNATTNELSTVETYALYHWFRNNQSLSGPGSTASVYRPTQNGAYSVVVTDTNGCINTSQIQFVNTVGIKNTPAAAHVKIYPNPTNGMLHIDAPEKVNLVIRDITGKAVINAENATELNVENLADGMYLLYITDAQGQLIKAEKITKSSR